MPAPIPMDWPPAQEPTPLPAVVAPILVEASQSVVRLRGGTGVWVDGRHLLTCAHVAQALGGETVGVDGAGAPVGLSLVWVLGRLDLAVYATAEGPYPALRRRAEPPREGEVVAALGFPGRGPLVVSVGWVEAGVAPLGTFSAFGHSAPTGWGSSGSPIVDVSGALLGVHWAFDVDHRRTGGLLGLGLEDLPVW